MNRSLWFVAGAGASVYAMLKARRAAELFTPEGLRVRMAGLGLGAHLFAEEVRAGMCEKESELRERFEWALDGPRQLEMAADTGGFRTLPGGRLERSAGAPSSTQGSPTTENLEDTD
jgi:hypothetical protein